MIIKKLSINLACLLVRLSQADFDDGFTIDDVRAVSDYKDQPSAAITGLRRLNLLERDRGKHKVVYKLTDYGYREAMRFEKLMMAALMVSEAGALNEAPA